MGVRGSMYYPFYTPHNCFYTYRGSLCRPLEPLEAFTGFICGYR
jgi:hypothetical protein